MAVKMGEGRETTSEWHAAPTLAWNFLTVARILRPSNPEPIKDTLQVLGILSLLSNFPLNCILS